MYYTIVFILPNGKFDYYYICENLNKVLHEAHDMHVEDYNECYGFVVNPKGTHEVDFYPESI